MALWVSLCCKPVAARCAHRFFARTAAGRVGANGSSERLPATHDDDDDVEGKEEEDTTTLPPVLVMSTSLRPTTTTTTTTGTNDPQSVPQSAAVTEVTALSGYMTNDTGTNSLISDLSDFPVPQNQTEAFKSYFGGDEQPAVAGPSRSRPECEEPEARVQQQQQQ